jgi:tetratricopeptide (TPR) repeat protein
MRIDHSWRIVLILVLLIAPLSRAQSRADAAKEQWDFNVAQIASMESLDQIIAVHQKFLEQYGDQPIAGDVKVSLENYQRLADKQGVKFRGKWMPAADVAGLQRAWEQQAQAAVRDYKSGDFQGAIDDANNALNADPDNPLALTILGLAEFKSNDLPASKQAFLKMLDSDPNDVIALNNLAIVCSRQNLTKDAMNYYARAVAAAPSNRLLLDNVAEEIHLQGKPTDPAAVNLNTSWQKAEKSLEPQMARQGLYRWNAAWISQSESNAMQSFTSTVELHMKDLQDKYDSDSDQVDRIQGQIEQNDREYANAKLETDEVQQASDFARLTQQGSDLQTALTGAKSTASDDESAAEPLKRQMAALQKVGYIGIQRMMEPGDDTNPPPPAKVQVPKEMP